MVGAGGGERERDLLVIFPVSFPIDFVYRKLAEKVNNSDHGTAGCHNPS